MRRPDPPLDPGVARELAELDAALAGDPAADPTLRELVGDVHAAAPAPSPRFLSELDERVAAGFARPAPARGRFRRSAAPLAVAATALAALVVVAVAGLRDGERAPSPAATSRGGSSAAVQQPGGGTPDAGRGVAGEGPQAAGGLAGGGAPSTGAPDSGTAPAPSPAAADRTRRVERAAQLTLTPATREIQSVADGVARTTRAVGGYVESSQVSTTGDGGSAALRLRLPSARLATAIERLSALAPVAALSQSSDDITGATGVAAERVADARAERRALLRALGRATGEREIAVLRDRLRLNRSRLAAAKGALESWRRRARLATVEVTVRPAEKAGESGGGGAWTPRDALRDALEVLQVAAGVALVGAAVLLPLLLLAIPAAVAARVIVRRRREHALDLL